MFLKTILVENCITPRQTAARKYSFQSPRFGISNLCRVKIRNNPPNRAPEKHHSTKEISGEDSSIIFFKILASHPVKTSARTLRNIESKKLLSRFLFCSGEIKTRLPATMRSIPVIPYSEGSSPRSTKALIKPTRDL